MGFMKMWVPGQFLLLLILFLADSSSGVPIGTLSAGDTDLTDLQALLTKNLPGTAEDKATIVELMLQLLAEIDLPTLCDVIANDTKSKRDKPADTATVNMQIVPPTVEARPSETAPIAISYLNTIGQTKVKLRGSNPRISLPGRKKLESRNPSYANNGLQHNSVANYHMSLLGNMEHRDGDSHTRREDINTAYLGQGELNTWSVQADAGNTKTNVTDEWRSSPTEYTVSNIDLSKHILNSGLESISSHENQIKQINAKSKNIPFDVNVGMETRNLGNQIIVKSIGIERPKNNLYSRSLVMGDATSEESLERMKRRRGDGKTELRQRYNANKFSAARRRKLGNSMKLKRRFPKQEMLPSRTEYQSDLYEFVLDKNTTSGFLNDYKLGGSSSTIRSNERSSTTAPQHISSKTSEKFNTEKLKLFEIKQVEQHLNAPKSINSSSLGNENKILRETANASLENNIPIINSESRTYFQTGSPENLHKQYFVPEEIRMNTITNKLNLEDNLGRINETMASNEKITNTEQWQLILSNQETEKLPLERTNNTETIAPFEHFDFKTESISSLDEFFGPYVSRGLAPGEEMKTEKTSKETKLPDNVNQDTTLLQDNLVNNLSEDLKKASSFSGDEAQNFWQIEEINQIINGTKKEDNDYNIFNSVEGPATVAENIADIESNLISYGINKDLPQPTTGGYNIFNNAVESTYERYVTPNVSEYEQGLSGSLGDTKTDSEITTSASIDDNTAAQLLGGDLSSFVPLNNTSDQNNFSNQSISLNTTTVVYTSDQNNVSSQLISLNTTTVVATVNVSYDTHNSGNNIHDYLTTLDSKHEDTSFSLDQRTHDVVSVQQESLKSEQIMKLSGSLNIREVTSPNSTIDSTSLGNLSNDGVSKNTSNDSVHEAASRNKNQDIKEIILKTESIGTMGNTTLEDNDFNKRMIVDLQSHNITPATNVDIQAENVTISSKDDITVTIDTAFRNEQFQADNMTSYDIGNHSVIKSNVTNSGQLVFDNIISIDAGKHNMVNSNNTSNEQLVYDNIISIDAGKHNMVNSNEGSNGEHMYENITSNDVGKHNMVNSNNTSNEQLVYDNIISIDVGKHNMVKRNETSSNSMKRDGMTSGMSEPDQVNNSTTKNDVLSPLDIATASHLQDSNITRGRIELSQPNNFTDGFHEPQELHVSKVAATFDTHFSPLGIGNDNNDLVIHYQTPQDPEPMIPTSPITYQVDGDQDQETTPEYTDNFSEYTGYSGKTEPGEDVRGWKKEMPSRLSQSEKDFISIVRGNHRGISSSVYKSFLGQPVMKSLKRIHEEKTRSSMLGKLSAKYRNEQHNVTGVDGLERTTTDKPIVSTDGIVDDTLSKRLGDNEKYTETVQTTQQSIKGQEVNYLNNEKKDNKNMSNFNTVAHKNSTYINESALFEDVRPGLLNETHLMEANDSSGNNKLDGLDGSVSDYKNLIKEQVQELNDSYAQENIAQTYLKTFHVNEAATHPGSNDAHKNISESYNHNVTLRVKNDGDDNLDLETKETLVGNTQVPHVTQDVSLSNKTINIKESTIYSDVATGNDDPVLADSRESQTLQESPKVIVTEINTQPLVDLAAARKITNEMVLTDESGKHNGSSYFSEAGQGSASYQLFVEDSIYTTSEPITEQINVETSAASLEEESTTPVPDFSEMMFNSATGVNDYDNDVSDIAVTPVTRRRNWAKTIERELKRAEKFRGSGSFDPDGVLPLRLYDRSYSKLGMMYDEEPSRFFYPPSFRNKVKPESSSFSAGISSWMKDGERNKAKKVTVNPWKAFNIELGKKKVERQREMSKGSKFQTYPVSNIKHHGDLTLPGPSEYLWNARPWPVQAKSSEQRTNNGFQKQKSRFGVTKLNELLRGRQGVMHFEPMRKAHAKQWGDRFSQGYYGRVLEEQNHAPTIIHGLGLPPHIDLASYNTHEMNAKNVNHYKATGHLGGKRSSHQDASRGPSRKWRQPFSENIIKNKFSTLTDERKDFGSFAASEVIGGAFAEWEGSQLETTTANPNIDAPVMDSVTGGYDTGVAPTNVPAEDFKCPGLFGYHSDPKDCNSFYMCSWGVSYKLQCSPGTLWNSRDAVCDWAANVNCDLNQGKATGPQY